MTLALNKQINILLPCLYTFSGLKCIPPQKVRISRLIFRWSLFVYFGEAALLIPSGNSLCGPGSRCASRVWESTLHPLETRGGGATKLSGGGCLGQRSVCEVLQLVNVFHRIKVISVLQNNLVSRILGTLT